MRNVIVLLGLLQAGAWAQTHEIAVTLQGMTPHLGQLFKARLMETPAGIQKAETTITAIGSATLLLKFTGESGKTYNLDYFADANGDKVYSAPPQDHGWRRAIPAVHHGGVALTFPHDVSFTDIKYPNGGSPVRFLASSGRLSGHREPQILLTPLSSDPPPDLEGFTLLGARAAAGSRNVLILPARPDLP